MGSTVTEHNVSEVKNEDSLILPELIDKDDCVILMYPTGTYTTSNPGIFIWALIMEGVVDKSCRYESGVSDANDYIESYDKNTGTLTAKYIRSPKASIISRLPDEAIIVTVY